tara:strand:+ start:788 stop:1078 length:291 start_codon:yes stop_codon:yes gene_type:complete
MKKTKLSPAKNVKIIRKNIDRIDFKILKLLANRRRQVLKIIKYKPKSKIVDKKRIKTMLNLRCKKAKALKIENYIIINIWRAMIKSFIKLERIKYK